VGWKLPNNADLVEYGNSLRDYAAAVARHWWVLLVSGLGALLGIVSLAHPIVIPLWAWLVVWASALLWAQFLAFHDVRGQVRKQADRRTQLAQLFGTELRSIRHKIEMVRGLKPTPHYSHDFKLPAYRWDEYDDELSAWPDLYAEVGKAYTAVDHFNTALDIRRTRANPGQTIGVTSDEDIDEVYEAAGHALDVLGSNLGPGGEPNA
jgi:hypothetical protein